LTEGAWITTSFGIGQMLAGVACPYLSAVFGVRRLLLLGIVSFFTASLLGPLSPNLPAFIAMQLIAGIGSGTFIPVAITFIVRNLPPRLVLYGLAAHSLNSEFPRMSPLRCRAGTLIIGHGTGSIGSIASC
jgi:DHA2 family multidrug resistance protein